LTAESANVSSEVEGEAQSDGDQLTISLIYRDLKVEFSGGPGTVLQSINSFIAKQIPEISLARKLALNFSAKDLVDKFQNFVKITPEGARVWSGERKFSDKELVALQLVAQRIASETLDASSGNPHLSSMTLSELQETTSLNPKSLSSRLSELAKLGLVQRDNSEEGTTFRITTQGIDWLVNTLSRKQQQVK